MIRSTIWSCIPSGHLYCWQLFCLFWAMLRSIIWSNWPNGHQHCKQLFSVCWSVEYFLHPVAMCRSTILSPLSSWSNKNHMISIWPSGHLHRHCITFIIEQWEEPYDRHMTKWPSTLPLYHFRHRAMGRTIWSPYDQVAVYTAIVSLSS